MTVRSIVILTVTVPLLLGGKPVGVLVLESRSPYPFDEDDRQLLITMGNWTAVGLPAAVKPQTPALQVACWHSPSPEGQWEGSVHSMLQAPEPLHTFAPPVLIGAPRCR